MNVIFLLLALVFSIVSAEIHDPLNIFCGSSSCYDILGVDRTATLKDIKKAYRRLSLTEHPDKSKADNATQVFQKIAKAFEVVTGNESRPLFDYYLDHPRDYFKVSGQHYYRNLPKSDVRIVIIFTLLLVSWFFHTIQHQKYQRAVKYLKTATINNLALKNGGTKQTMELYRRATALYDKRIAELKSQGDKSAGKTKMLKDPLFEKCVDEVVGEVKIEGGHRKPEWQDLVIVQCFKFPHTLFLWAKTYHRRYISTEPLPMEDKIEMARSRVGIPIWEEMPAAEQEKLISRCIWRSDTYETWCKEKEEEELKRMAKGKAGSSKALKKRMRKAQSSEDEDDDYYVD